MSMLTSDLRRAFPAAATSEVGFQDQWQRAALGVALVAPDHHHLERLIVGVRRYFDGRPDAELLELELSYLERQ